MDKISNYDYISKVMALATEGSLLRRLIDNAYSVDFFQFSRAKLQGDYKHELIKACRADSIQLHVTDAGYVEGCYFLEESRTDVGVDLVFT